MIKLEKIKLANKIRIVKNQKKFDSCSENHRSFYTKYAFIVSRTLRKPIFQNFLKFLIKNEQIEKKSVKDIQIRVFPFIKNNGKSIAGRCNSKGIIRIFPKRQKFLKKKLQNHKEKTHFYIRSRAMAALIHEILHIKYEGNEHKVRKLTKKYFKIFIHHQNPNSQCVNNIHKMVFKGL